MPEYQPKTGQRCSCKPGVQRDNCSECEGTGMRIDFAAIRARKLANAEHTPGPWIIAEPGPFDWIITIADGSTTVAEAKRVMTTDDSTIVQANATLIAAAPDLLAALEAALYTIKALDENYDQRNSYIEGKRVVRKAKGESC